MVEVGEGGVEFLADFIALEGARGSEDGEFSNARGNVDGAGVTLECGSAGDVVGYFFGYEGDVGTEGFRGEAEFDELVETSVVN